MKAESGMRGGVLRALCAGIVFFAMGSPAFALSVNFTDGTWDGAHGTASFTSHSSGIDLFASYGKLSVNYDFGGPSGDNSGNDGLGITDDEISGSERLKIAFSSAVRLESVYITDLFQNEGGTGKHEIGLYSINGGSYQSFASVGGSNGALTLNIFQSGVSYITFKSYADTWSDFSVKGLKYSVAEPASLFFLGLGLLMFWTFFRTQRASAR
jgi:hypothetical protein